MTRLLEDEIVGLGTHALSLAVRTAAVCARLALDTVQPEAARLKMSRDLKRGYKALLAADRWARTHTNANRLAAAAAARDTRFAIEIGAAIAPVVALAIDAAADVAIAPNAGDSFIYTCVDSVLDIVSEHTIRAHLESSGWLLKYNWTRIQPDVYAPQFPYTHGPFLVHRDTCWTLAELRSKSRSRDTQRILVAIDAAIEGRIID